VRDVDDEAVVERLEGTATGFGQLLQLVNVAKDVHVDYTEENSVYLPADWLDEVGVPQEAVLARDHRAAVASVVARTAEHARSSLDDAHAYLDALARVDRNAFAAFAVPFLLAVGTLRELSDRPGDALTPGGVTVSRDEVEAIVAAVTTDAGPESLAALRASVRRGTLH
jgi:farnesyl-diphosphate farnesyltransferase